MAGNIKLSSSSHALAEVTQDPYAVTFIVPYAPGVVATIPGQDPIIQHDSNVHGTGPKSAIRSMQFHARDTDASLYRDMVEDGAGSIQILNGKFGGYFSSETTVTWVDCIVSPLSLQPQSGEEVLYDVTLYFFIDA